MERSWLWNIIEMTDESHLSTKISTCPEGNDGQTSGDTEFRKSISPNMKILCGVLVTIQT